MFPDDSDLRALSMFTEDLAELNFQSQTGKIQAKRKRQLLRVVSEGQSAPQGIIMTKMLYDALVNNRSDKLMGSVPQSRKKETWDIMGRISQTPHSCTQRTAETHFLRFNMSNIQTASVSRS